MIPVVLARDAPPSDVSWVAIVGAVTGVVALVITLVRWLREGPRLHITFGVHDEFTPSTRRPVATLRIVNGGGLPAYIDDIAVTDKVPWQFRWPVLRSLSFQTRNRRVIRLLGRGAGIRQTRVVLDPEPDERLDPGELVRATLSQIVNGAPEPLDADRVEKLTENRSWIVVDTSTRCYVRRISDNRFLLPLEGEFAP
jgi:hypothetical protein